MEGGHAENATASAATLASKSTANGCSTASVRGATLFAIGVKRVGFRPRTAIDVPAIGEIIGSTKDVAFTCAELVERIPRRVDAGALSARLDAATFFIRARKVASFTGLRFERLIGGGFDAARGFAAFGCVCQEPSMAARCASDTSSPN
jgi:hypothetical protein